MEAFVALFLSPSVLVSEQFECPGLEGPVILWDRMRKTNPRLGKDTSWERGSEALAQDDLSNPQGDRS